MHRTLRRRKVGFREDRALLLLSAVGGRAAPMASSPSTAPTGAELAKPINKWSRRLHWRAISSPRTTAANRRRSNAWLPPAQTAVSVRARFCMPAIRSARSSSPRFRRKTAASKNFTTQRRFSQRPVRVASDLRDDVARRHDPAVEPDLMRTRSRVDFGARRACKPWSAERRLIDL